MSRQPLKLYGFPPTRSLRVLWVLQELDIEFEFINVQPIALRDPELN
ncbi:MAG: thioredoxin domain-containing protein [Myxococcales bacterium]